MQNQKTSKLAIATFVLAIISILPLVGVIIGAATSSPGMYNFGPAMLLVASLFLSLIGGALTLVLSFFAFTSIKRNKLGGINLLIASWGMIVVILLTFGFFTQKHY